jgi:superfamily I DNA/RNA helicase
MWQLSEPRIPGDFVLVDEAQDLSPVMLDAVHQSGAANGQQPVWVGDSQQQLYEWRGAINALGMVEGQRAFLTQSWRFGEAIADVANVLLAELNADIRLIGHPGMDSRVGLCHPTAVLCRSNVGAVDTVLRLQRAGRHPHLVGGGEEVVRFAKAVSELQETGSTYHP